MAAGTGSDRALQDAVIRLLADAPFRAALRGDDRVHALDGIPPAHESALRATDPERVRRFAHFLARGYYHERIVHFYKYSRILARWTGMRPADVLRTADFDALLDTIVLGSRESACAVAELVEAALAEAPAAPPYAADLLRYESAQMITEAGPRVWSSSAPPPALAPTTVAATSPDVLVLDFEWDLPALLPTLLAVQAAPSAPPSPPTATRRPTQLLFARSPRARVTVMRCTATLAALVAAMDGTRELHDIAVAAGITDRDVVEIASALAEAGAIHVA